MLSLEEGKVSPGMEIVNLRTGCELIGKKKQEEGEDRQQPQEQEGPQLVATAASQDTTKSSSLLPLPIASEQGQDEKAIMVADGVLAPATSDRMKIPIETAAAAQGGRLPLRGWGDCLPHVVLLRKALLSSAPEIAVLGPLHGCFAFYVTHLHNEVLSSPYAKSMSFGANVTRLESAFMWIGGWRPTSAMVLVYSLMGMDIENALQAVRDGRVVGECSTSSLLSTRQLAVMHSLQKHTQHTEMKISKKLTVLQMLIGDQDVLTAVLKDAASPIANDSSRFHQVAEKRMSRFKRLLVQAEELRLHTLKDLLSLLTPIQAARCGVAVFELCSSLRTMGSPLPPTLPAFTTKATLPLSDLSGIVGKSSIFSFDEPEALHSSSPESIPKSPDVPLIVLQKPIISHKSILNSPDVPLCLVQKPIISVFSTGDNSILNSSDLPISVLQKRIISELSICDNSILNSSDAPLGLLRKPEVSDLSTSVNSILNSSDVVLPVSESYRPPLAANVSFSSNVLHASDVQLQQSDETALLVPSGGNILNSSDVVVPVSESDKPPLAADVSFSSNVLHASDVQLQQSDETALLVPSCGNNSSSQLLAQDSSRGLRRDHKSRSWPTTVPLVRLNLDDVTVGEVSTSATNTSTDEHRQRVYKRSDGETVSNRLLLLSPASSDVVIQDCSLDSSGLASYFEISPQLPCASDDMGISYQRQPGSGESHDMGGSCQTPQGRIEGRMSVPCECAQQESQSKEEAEKYN